MCSVKIKICGLTNLQDTLFAVSLGVNYIGFIQYKKSPRFVNINTIKNIVSKIPSNVIKVGIFVNEHENVLKEIQKLKIFDVFQFHGDESSEFCEKFKDIKVFKAFRVKNSKDLQNIKDYNVDGYLIDTYEEGIFGGTGKSFDWSILKKFSKRPLILSGGLNIDNVLDAIKMVNPDIVDINSGIEISPGKKDLKKMEEIVKIINN